MAIASIAIQGMQALKGLLDETMNTYSGSNYEIPPSIKKMLSEAKVGADSVMPGVETQRSRIEAGGARTIGRAKEMGVASALPGVASDIYSKELEGFRDIDILQQQYDLSQRDKYQKALQLSGEYEDKQWEVNKNIPEMMRLNEAYNRKAATQQNLFGAVKSMDSMFMADRNFKMQMQMLDKIFGDTGLDTDIGSIDPFDQNNLSNNELDTSLTNDQGYIDVESMFPYE